MADTAVASSSSKSSPSIQSPTSAITSVQTPPSIPTARTTPENATWQTFLQPFLFISSHRLPLERSTIDSLRKHMSSYDIEHVKMDDRGYYISFSHGYQGMQEAQRCYEELNTTEFNERKLAIVSFVQVMEDIAPWRQALQRTHDSEVLPLFGAPSRASGEEIARFFDYDSMEHFMRCMGWNFLDKSDYEDAEAMLMSWRMEATYVLDPRTNIRR